MLLNPEMYISGVAVMNVIPGRLMYISVMNRYKMRHEILKPKSVHQLFV